MSGIRFDGVDDRYTTNSTALRNLPDSDWTVIFRYIRDDHSGGNLQYIYSNGLTTDPGTLNVWFTGASSGTPNQARANVNGGTTVFLTSSVAEAPSTVERNLCISRSVAADRIYLHHISAGTSAVQGDAKAPGAVGALVPAADLMIGNRTDLTSDRYWTNWIGEWARWDSALTTDQMEAFANGYRANQIGGANLVGHFIMSEPSTTMIDLTGNGNNMVAGAGQEGSAEGGTYSNIPTMEGAS